MKTTKIGILGSGAVGQTLAGGFLKYGNQVMIGTRDASKLTDWKNKNNALIGSFREAAQFGNILVLALKGVAVKNVLREISTGVFQNKTIIDATNPIAEEDPVNGVINFFTKLDKSLLEELQDLLPEAHLVKAFNSVGSTFMVNPDFNGIKPTMFICGNNEPAKQEVIQILEQFGWEAEDMGKVEAARAIEPLCILWCIPGFLKNEWAHAFKLLKK